MVDFKIALVARTIINRIEKNCNQLHKGEILPGDYTFERAKIEADLYSVLDIDEINFQERQKTEKEKQ